jgi:hypothetical protein
MYTRLRIELEPFYGFQKYLLNDSSVLEWIKTGQNDIIYHKNRHEKNIVFLKYFTTSEYVSTLEKNYGFHNIILNSRDPSRYEFDILDLEGIDTPNPKRIK